MDWRDWLSTVPVFSTLDVASLERLAALVQPYLLASGACLYAPGDPADDFYLLVSGRVRLGEGERLVGYISAREPLGEAAVLADEPHSTAAYGVRDSLLLRIPRQPLIDFLTDHPGVLLALTQLMVRRQGQTHRDRRRGFSAAQTSIAIVPAAPQVPVAVLAEALVRRLSGWPDARIVGEANVDAELGAGSATSEPGTETGEAVEAYLRTVESQHRYVIYISKDNNSPWAVRCLRHADRVLLLTEAGMPVKALPAFAQLPHRLLAPVELVFLCAEGDRSPYTRDWREACRARAHYYVQPWYGPDLDALARQITGRGLGLVLGGGGARGFAHIGLIRALEQLQIPVDVMGGTSMGAFVSALLACGLDSIEMTQVVRDTFINRNYLNDYTVPRVSLIRGRKFHQRLLEVFGEQRIEELRRSYFCISSNLSSGETVVHEYGGLATWVATSMCVPGVAPPVVYKGELLCDGGVVDNLPTDVLENMERGTIIASSVSSQSDIHLANLSSSQPDPDALLRRIEGVKRPHFGEILLRTATLNSDTVIYPESVERADICLHMPVTDVNMFDWKALDTLIERGYRHALEVLSPWCDQLKTGEPVSVSGGAPLRAS